LAPVVQHALEGSRDGDQVGTIQHDLTWLHPYALMDASVGEYDRVADSRWLRRERREVREKRVFGSRRLDERVFDLVDLVVAIGREPPTIDYGDAPSLDLQDDQTVTRMERNEVRLPVTLTTTTHGLPAHLVEDVPLVAERCQRLPHSKLGSGCVRRGRVGMELRHGPLGYRGARPEVSLGLRDRNVDGDTRP
jgi:hypothetical protein